MDVLSYWSFAFGALTAGALCAGLIAAKRRFGGRDALAEQNVLLDAALNNMTQGLNMFDAAGRLVLSNDRYVEMYRLSPMDVKPGITVRDLVDLRLKAGTFFKDIEPADYTKELMDSIIERKPTRATRELADGRVISVVNQPMAGGGWVVTHLDATERERAERERAQAHKFLHTVIDNVPATIVVKNALDRKYVLINRAGEEFYGAPREQLVGKTAEQVFPPERAAVIADYDQQTLQSKRKATWEEHPLLTPGQGSRIVTTARLPILGEDGEPRYLLTVVQDVTERKRAEARIERLAHYDSLTDLPNRAAFNACFASVLERAAGSQESFALLSIDLDRFKEINDVFGHAVGDRLLRAVAERMGAAVEGAFLARTGGDEFAVLVTESPAPTQAARLAERLLAAVADAFQIDSHQLKVGLSVGVAIYPLDGADATALVGNADAALYRAKAGGRGSIRFFEVDMDQRLRERRALLHDLRSAVERGELVVYYQPQATIEGKIIGFEALIRWHHPAHGQISPAEFIPMAEESGLILPVGEWVLREACREAASWPNKLAIAVNLSALQFRHGDLAGLVHEVLLESGLSPSRLELEITESVLIDDLPRALAILRRLKALGVRIAMDDFGTGYSSLSNLQAFPFDKLKIDRSFISNVDQNAHSATIVRAVLALGRGLNMPVLAEGVETQAQLAFLSAEACSEVQGYLLGRPRPIVDYAALVGRAVAPEPKAANVA
jgi:diguanylate cyclase (GGDEF)-like protein/PAS domain S-box-containing protein